MTALRVLSAALALLLAGAGLPYGTLYGFTVLSSDAERAAESQFLDIPSASGAMETGTAIASQPRVAGSPADYAAAVALRDQFRSFGFSATIEPLTARVDTPKLLALTYTPTGVATRASLLPRLPRLPRLPAIFRKRQRKAPRHTVAVAAAPSPTPAPVVAVAPTPVPSRPVKLDLRELPIESDADTANPAIGLPFLAGSADGDVTGPLVYAARGSDADYALLASHDVSVKGAIAIVRVSHEFRGVVARRAQAHGVAGVLFYDDPSEDGPERGAAYPYGAYRPATAVRRGTVGEGVIIPVLPISAANAQLLLGALHGPTAPAPWRGGLAVGYPIARGPATARLTIKLARKSMTLWNTIAVMPGLRPQQSVVLGAHRDAWVYGAGDNASGVETLVEAARGLGYIAKSGWHPQRSIVMAAWDGEELGAYGTTAYVKSHGDEMRMGGVAYLAAEQTVIGPRFGSNAVAAIAGVVADATQVVDDPAQPGNSLFNRWARYTFVMPPRVLGDIDDRTPSPLFALGIPSANAGFSGPFGVYDSAYDTTTYANTISDPGFALHRSAGQLYGIMAMRIADADVVPYRFAAYVPMMRTAVRRLVAEAKGGKTHVDANGLGVSIGRFAAAAQRFDTATTAATNAAAGEQALEAARTLDVAVYGADGYGSVTLPEVAHALAQGDQHDLDGAVARTRATIDHATELLLATPAEP
jgi:N-acetylated-alpha-linked acidic dipeptidase